MSARNKHFPWPSHYGHFRFFEQRMNTHSRLRELTPQDAGVYLLTRDDGTKIRTFICECYAFGVAQYLETVEKIGSVNAVVINSAWCGYTPDAKYYCREQQVGLFTIGEFMSALRQNEYWNYLTNEETEFFEKQGWL
jgi:hypothetical protein